ncbi:hypothetical protein MMC32_001576 [Xylographa parallela]|nr:hypothetical protein [Xylographa parallela]
MPLTDSEATAGGFYVGVVGLALAAIEFVIVWWGRLRGLLVDRFELYRLTDGLVECSRYGWWKASYQPPTEAEYNGLQTSLQQAAVDRAENAEGRLTTAEDLLTAERQAHETTMAGLLATERQAHQTAMASLAESHRTALEKVQRDLLVAETKLDCWAEVREELKRDLEREVTRRERAERSLLLRSLRRRR